MIPNQNAPRFCSHYKLAPAMLSRMTAIWELVRVLSHCDEDAGESRVAGRPVAPMACHLKEFDVLKTIHEVRMQWCGRVVRQDDGIA
jgi:hypothetical protein